MGRQFDMMPDQPDRPGNDSDIGGGIGDGRQGLKRVDHDFEPFISFQM